MTALTVVIGSGSIGQAIARRVSAGKHVLLADLRPENAEAAAVTLRNAGFDVTTAPVDVSVRASVRALVEHAVRLGEVTGLVHAAGVSPSQAAPETILRVDLYGTALVLEEFGQVISRGGSGVVIASQSGHRLPALTPEQDEALATTPTEELLGLPMLQPDSRSAARGHRPAARLPGLQARQRLARHGRGGKPLGPARSPHQHDQPRDRHDTPGERRAQRPARRRLPADDPGMPRRPRWYPDEVASVGALLMGPDGGFITGSDILMDGGVTASYWYGALAATRAPS